MKAVVADLGSPGQIRILGVSTAKPPRLLWHEMRVLGEREEPWPVLKDMLAGRSAQSWPICWIPSREEVGTAVLTLPPIPRKEIAKILPRELGRLTESSRELTGAFVPGEKIEEKGVVKQEVISSYMPRSDLYEALDRMRALGLSPRWVLPETAGHLQLLETLGKTIQEPLSGTVLFKVCQTKIAMTIYRGTSWGLERVFTFRHGEDQEITEDELTRISVEINRTLQFFKQRYRGVNVDRLVIFGRHEARDRIVEHIRSSQALHVVSAEQLLSEERIDFGPVARKDLDFASEAAIALHLLPLVGRSNDLDLFPGGYVERERMRSRIVGLGISYGVIATLLAVATVYLLGIKKDYRQQIDELQRVVSQQEAQNEQLEKTRKRRIFYYQWEHFKLWPRRYTAICTDFVRRLTLMATPEIRLSELTLEPRAHGAVFVLKGNIAVADSIAAQSIFIRFFDQIKTLPEVLGLDSSNVKVNAARETSGRSYTAEALPKDSVVELYFSINGELEWP